MPSSQHRHCSRQDSDLAGYEPQIYMPAMPPVAWLERRVPAWTRAWRRLRKGLFRALRARWRKYSEGRTTQCPSINTVVGHTSADQMGSKT